MLDTLSLRKQPAWERTNKLEGAVGAVGRFSLIRTFQADHEVPTTSPSRAAYESFRRRNQRWMPQGS